MNARFVTIGDRSSWHASHRPGARKESQEVEFLFDGLNLRSLSFTSFEISSRFRNGQTFEATFKEADPLTSKNVAKQLPGGPWQISKDWRARRSNGPLLAGSFLLSELATVCQTGRRAITSITLSTVPCDRGRAPPFPFDRAERRSYATGAALALLPGEALLHQQMDRTRASW